MSIQSTVNYGKVAEEMGKTFGVLCRAVAVRAVKEHASMNEVERLRRDVKLLEMENEILRRRSLKP